MIIQLYLNFEKSPSKNLSKNVDYDEKLIFRIVLKIIFQILRKSSAFIKKKYAGTWNVLRFRLESTSLSFVWRVERPANSVWNPRTSRCVRRAGALARANLARFAYLIFSEKIIEYQYPAEENFYRKISGIHHEEDI